MNENACKQYCFLVHFTSFHEYIFTMQQTYDIQGRQLIFYLFGLQAILGFAKLHSSKLNVSLAIL